jgi:AcrR family transcriptional regulator
LSKIVRRKKGLDRKAALSKFLTGRPVKSGAQGQREALVKARDKILEAADDLFGEVGFDAATTREIAERSGVNKALIHYHFKNKDTLFATLLDRYYERLGATLQETLLVNGPLRDRLSTLLDTYLDFLEQNRNFGRIVQREASGGRHMDRIREQMVPLFDLGTRAVKGAFPATGSGDLAAEQLLVSFYGMIISYFTYAGVLEHLLGGDPFSKGNLEARKRHLRRMLAMVLDTVEGEAGE